MSKLISGGLKYRSEYIFNSHLTQANARDLEKLTVDSENLMRRLGASLVKALPTVEDKVQTKRIGLLSAMYNMITEAGVVYTSSICILPVLRGLDVAFYYEMKGEQYQLIDCRVTNSEIASKVKDEEELFISDQILAWVKHYELTQTTTVPSTINPNTLNELGLRLKEGSEDDLPKYLRVDATLTVRQLDLMQFKKTLTIETVIRGWLSDLNTMLTGSYPKMVAVAHNLSTNIGLLSKDFTPDADMIAESVELLFTTQVSMVRTLNSIGFDVPLKLDDREIEGKFEFGQSMYTSIEFLNAWISCITYTQRMITKLNTSDKVKAFLSELTQEDLNVKSNLNYFRSYPYQCVGVSLQPMYIFIDNVLENPVLFRNKTVEESPKKPLLDLSRILFLSYDQAKVVAKATGYTGVGTKNPITRSVEKLLKDKFNVQLDYNQANQLFREYLPIIRESSLTVSTTKKLFLRRM